MWYPAWVGWDQLINCKSFLLHGGGVQICALAWREALAADGISTGRSMNRDCNQDEDWGVIRKSWVWQPSGANNTVNELWKPGPLLTKLKMPLSSFLVVPAELNDYCSETIQCSARAEAKSLPRVSPEEAALIHGEGSLPLVNRDWLMYIKNAVKSFAPWVQLNSVTPNQDG